MSPLYTWLLYVITNSSFLDRKLYFIRKRTISSFQKCITCQICLLLLPRKRTTNLFSLFLSSWFFDSFVLFSRRCQYLKIWSFFYSIARSKMNRLSSAFSNILFHCGDMFNLVMSVDAFLRSAMLKWVPKINGDFFRKTPTTISSFGFFLPPKIFSDLDRLANANEKYIAAPPVSTNKKILSRKIETLIGENFNSRILLSWLSYPENFSSIEQQGDKITFSVEVPP